MTRKVRDCGGFFWKNEHDKMTCTLIHSYKRAEWQTSKIHIDNSKIPCTNTRNDIHTHTMTHTIRHTLTHTHNDIQNDTYYERQTHIHTNIHDDT